MHYFCQEKVYRLVTGDDNTDENHKVKNHLLSQKYHQLENLEREKGLRSQYDDEIVKSNTVMKNGHMEIHLKVTEVSNKTVWFTLDLF